MLLDIFSFSYKVALPTWGEATLPELEALSTAASSSDEDKETPPYEEHEIIGKTGGARYVRMLERLLRVYLFSPFMFLILL